MSRRRYAARRLGAAGALLLMLAGAVWAVSTVAGGNDGGDGDDRGLAVAAAGPGTPATPLASSATPATPVMPVTPPGQPAGPPSADEPVRVLIVGDSDAGTFGPYLQQLLRGTGVVETELEYKVSSGLARPDFYDWPAELDRILPAVDPDIVVVTFGGNDAQYLADRTGASVVGQPRADSENVEWTAEYRERAGAVMDQLSAEGRSVIWVGIPNHIDPNVTFRMQLQDDAVKLAVAERPEIRFVDTWNRFRGRNGNFAEYLVDPRDGTGKPVRASDGFHLNQVGAEILAIDIADVVFEELRARGAPV